MLAEAADACIHLASPARMLEISRHAWELPDPDAGERERFFANLALGTATPAPARTAHRACAGR
jgi:hypothetical protein